MLVMACPLRCWICFFLGASAYSRGQRLTPHAAVRRSVGSRHPQLAWRNSRRGQPAACPRPGGVCPPGQRRSACRAAARHEQTRGFERSLPQFFARARASRGVRGDRGHAHTNPTPNGHKRAHRCRENCAALRVAFCMRSLAGACSSRTSSKLSSPIPAEGAKSNKPWQARALPPKGPARI